MSNCKTRKMTKIIKHAYIAKNHTPLYKSPDSNEIVAYLPKGIWVGVLYQRNDWMQVISKNYDGWIRSSKMVPKPSPIHNLKIRINSGQIQYFFQRNLGLAS